MLVQAKLTSQIIRSAIEVHRTLGPGLLESVYAVCLADELACIGIPCAREVSLPVIYKSRVMPLGFHADMIVADAVLLEIKAVPEVAPAHKAQVITYLRISGLKTGLLLNFHAPRLKDGLYRFVT